MIIDKTILAKVINDKQRKLSRLENLYDSVIETEKTKVLKAKSEGMTKTNYLLSFEFKSSGQQTPQYLKFHKIFKREFKRLLEPFCTRIQISKPNHFDVSGFFKTNKGIIYYFSLSDLRWDKSFLIRTAKNFEDYTGGSNCFIELENLEKEIKPYLLKSD